jgi:hypothetical protein
VVAACAAPGEKVATLTYRPPTVVVNVADKGDGLQAYDAAVRNHFKPLVEFECFVHAPGAVAYDCTDPYYSGGVPSDATNVSYNFFGLIDSVYGTLGLVARDVFGSYPNLKPSISPSPQSSASCTQACPYVGGCNVGPPGCVWRNSCRACIPKSASEVK